MGKPWLSEITAKPKIWAEAVWSQDKSFTPSYPHRMAGDPKPSACFHVCELGTELCAREQRSVSKRRLLSAVTAVPTASVSQRVSPLRAQDWSQRGSPSGHRGPPTWEGVLRLEESAEPPFHVRQAALALLVSLSLQVGDCHFELFKTGVKRRSHEKTMW